MKAVAQGQNGEVAGLCTFNCHLHRLFCNDMAKPLPAIDQQKGAFVLNDLCRCFGDELACQNTFHIGGDHPNTMTVVACQIGTDQPRGDFGGGVRVASGMAEDGRCQCSQVFSRNFHQGQAFVFLGGQGRRLWFLVRAVCGKSRPFGGQVQAETDHWVLECIPWGRVRAPRC